MKSTRNTMYDCMKAALIMNVTKQAASSHHRWKDALTMAPSEDQPRGARLGRSLVLHVQGGVGKRPLRRRWRLNHAVQTRKICGPTECHVGQPRSVLDDNLRAASSDAHCFVRHSLCRGYVSNRRRQPTSRNDVTDVTGCDANDVVVGVWLDVDRQRALPQAGKMRRKTPGEPSAWTMA